MGVWAACFLSALCKYQVWFHYWQKWGYNNETVILVPFHHRRRRGGV